jgi:hypothetical protein
VRRMTCDTHLYSLKLRLHPTRNNPTAARPNNPSLPLPLPPPLPLPLLHLHRRPQQQPLPTAAAAAVLMMYLLRYLILRCRVASPNDRLLPRASVMLLVLLLLLAVAMLLLLLLRLLRRPAAGRRKMPEHWTRSQTRTFNRTCARANTHASTPTTQRSKPIFFPPSSWLTCSIFAVSGHT